MKYVFVGRADQSKQIPVYYFYRIKRYRSWYQRWYHVDFKRYLISVYPDLLLPGFKNRGNGDCYGMELCFKKDFP